MKKVPLVVQVAALTAAMEAGVDYEESLKNDIAALRMARDGIAATKDNDIRYYKDRNEETVKVYDGQLREKSARVVQLGEEVAQLKEKVNVANATRDLVIRMVDQFTSLQITPLNTTVAVHTNNANTPAELRKT